MRFETRCCVERPALGGDVCGSLEVRDVKCSVEHDQFVENRENVLSCCGVRSRLALVLFKGRIAFTKRAAKLPALSESSRCQAARHLSALVLRVRVRKRVQMSHLASS